MCQQQVASYSKVFVAKPPKIKAQQHECTRSHIPNAETLRVIKDAQLGIDMVECKDLDDMFEKLGI